MGRLCHFSPHRMWKRWRIGTIPEEGSYKSSASAVAESCRETNVEAACVRPNRFCQSAAALS
jgi:hypothetical protein